MLVTDFADDFQTICSQFLSEMYLLKSRDIRRIFDTPLPVRKCHVSHFFQEAASQKYTIGDDRSDPTYLADMVEAIRTGNPPVPPIIVRGLRLLDGRHRVLAHRQLRKRTILCFDLASWIAKAILD